MQWNIKNYNKLFFWFNKNKEILLHMEMCFEGNTGLHLRNSNSVLIFSALNQ